MTMARGNDGNLLQHTVEAKIATELAGQGQGLYLVCTHAMAPFERLRPRNEEYVRGRMRFDWWWARAANEALLQAEEPPVLVGYRNCRQQNHDLYPNTGQIISALLGRDHVNGVLVEYDQCTFDQLMRWSLGGCLKPVRGSWRARLNDIQAPSLDYPWLFTMDPMTFTQADLDDDKLHPADLDRLVAPVRSFLQSGQRGVFAAFCYSFRMEADDAAYRGWTDDFARQIGIPNIELEFVDIGRKALGYSHVGSLISLDRDLLRRVVRHWEETRDHQIP